MSDKPTPGERMHAAYYEHVSYAKPGDYSEFWELTAGGRDAWEVAASKMLADEPARGTTPRERDPLLWAAVAGAAFDRVFMGVYGALHSGTGNDMMAYERALEFMKRPSTAEAVAGVADAAVMALHPEAPTAEHTVDLGCARPTHKGPEATCPLCHPKGGV